jgi:hypothetical protein
MSEKNIKQWVGKFFTLELLFGWKTGKFMIRLSSSSAISVAIEVKVGVAIFLEIQK